MDVQFYENYRSLVFFTYCCESFLIFKFLVIEISVFYFVYY